MISTRRQAVPTRPGPLATLLAGIVALTLSSGALSPASGQEHPPIVAMPTRALPTVSARADSLLDNGKVRRSFDLLERVLERHPDDFAARWRAARAAVYMGILAGVRQTQNSWYRKGIANAKRALAERPDDLSALRWAVAAEGSLAQQTGARETLTCAQDVSRLAHRMLELDPRSAFAHDALGTLDYRIMGLSSWKRLLARMLAGGSVLEGASWRKALEYHRDAVALDPGSILYRLDLANTLVRTGHVDQATDELRVAVTLPERLPVDSTYHARAEARLAGLERLSAQRDATR